MSNTLPSPVPKNLREQMLKFITNAPEDRLPDLHTRLLIAERDQLWAEMGEQAQADFETGKFEGVNESVQAYRSRNRQK